jgi:excisionase family DNA binding protein
MPTESKSNTGPRVLTVRELAAYLRVHQTTVYRLLREQKLPAFRIGADWRFNREDRAMDDLRTKTKLICVPRDRTATIA